MKLSFLITIFITALASCFASLSQSIRRDDPPPPSGEYFLRTWVEYNSSSGKYKIKFPKTPREYSEVQEGVGGPSTVYIAEHKGLLLYVTTYGDSPSHISDAKVFLSNISQAWLKANAARKLQVIKNEEVTLGGHPARFLQVETQQDVVRVRWIVVKDRVYYQFVAAPKHSNAMESENGYQKLAMGFFDSFELTK